MTTLLQLESSVEEGTLEYPCLLIEGLKYKIEYSYFKDTLSGGMPLYVNIDGEYLQLGTADLDHSLFITLKLISDGFYKLYLCKDADNMVEIDYSDPKTAESALRVR